MTNILKVLFTGFGSFRDFTTNISSLSVDLIPNLSKKEKGHCNFEPIILSNLEVAYEYVDNMIERIWNEIKPDIVIHVGLHSYSKVLVLEKLSRNGPYDCEDVKNAKSKKHDHCCIVGGENIVTTRFDVDKISQSLKDLWGIESQTSDNCGLYLCGYIYYGSLCHNRNTLFVHVPPDYDKELTADILIKIANLIVNEYFK